MRSARNSNACSQSFVASRSKRMSSQPLDSQVARYDCFRGPFPITDRLTYYPFCVNTYAECVSHIYWTHYSRLSVRKFWRQHYSLRENPGFCPSWQNILRLLLESSARTRNPRRKRSSAAHTGRPASLLQSRDHFSGLPGTSRPVFQDGGLSLFSNPTSPDSVPRLPGPLSMGSVARGEEQTRSDVDLLVVGSVGLAELLPALRRIEQQFGREVECNAVFRCGIP